ncbi:MAG: PLP-dependent aminotransferase family protein [Anaeromicrobium sp.]|jgi:DNA-binding transcriptional MocR family regulator|uniref:aminotransferase-like domain-containing protein n=1 Tax=Anaeromicrobium sp. TaxID=1929132 RepID=UPI0025EC73B2|nr:PLP-dependent aminotransferase family protein [Anaeromicrobium sp.]MCT4593415.1 PLP-dependent aminotransferase family protein [Anaeromicrobium sp.]
MNFANRIHTLRPSAIRAAGKLIRSKENCISFAAGLPSSALMPINEIREVTDRLLSEKGAVALQYGATKGYDPLLDEICKIMAKRHVHCKKEEIQITTGSQQGIFLTAMTFLNPGDTVITEKPTYLGALSSYTPFECNFRGVDADNEGMLIDELEKALEEEKNVKFVYAVPNFSNPTGKTWSVDRRKKLVQLANKYDIMIIEDNPYGEIRFSGEHVPTIKSFDTEDRVIYLGSFSKILFPGLRVGFSISNTAIANHFEVLKQGIDLQSNQFAQAQIAEYLKAYNLDEQIEQIVKVYGKKKDMMLEIIKEKFPKSIKHTNPEGGMFIWLDLPKGVDATKLLEKSIEEISVGFVPGGSFFTEPGYENTIRLNFSTVDEEEIIEGMNRLADFLTKELEK